MAMTAERERDRGRDFVELVDNGDVRLTMEMLCWR